MASGDSIDAVPESVPLTGERRRRNREILARQGRVTVNELSKLFRVTVVTIRSDLDAMASEGALGNIEEAHIEQRGEAIRSVRAPFELIANFKELRLA